MFRPYNLTSIAAWTVGSLAGNLAYYAVKKKHAGIILNQGGLQPTSLAPASNPPYVQKVFNKCMNVGNEVVKLHSDLSSAYTRETNTLNTTPLLKLVAYCNWLNSNKNRIKDEIRAVLDRAKREGYVYEKSIQTLIEETDSLVKTVNLSKDDMLRQVYDLLDQNDRLASAPQKPKALELFDLILSNMQVDEKSWKLKEFNGSGLKLVGPKQNADTTTCGDQNIKTEALSKAPSEPLPKSDEQQIKFAATNPTKKKSKPAKSRNVETKGIAEKFNQIYIARDSQAIGPYSYAQMLDWVKTRPDDLVAYDSASEWIKLKDLIAKIESGQI